jgi:RNA 2',3'-cyclic 3'-phosphodiesterase
MPHLPEKIRAFVALRLGAEAEDAIARFVGSLRQLQSGIRWVRPANLHLTLRFLGAAIDSNLIPPVDEQLSAIAARTSPFKLCAHGTGAFPNLERPRAIWIGLLSDELRSLAESIESAAVHAGFAREARTYSPHLTIGRARDLRGWHRIRRVLEQASNHDFGSAEIGEMILYRSILGGEASQYLELARYRLTGAASRT